MPHAVLMTTILIAMYLTSTRLGAQNVYKCEDQYSDRPCPGAVTLDVPDSRSAAQKTQADKATTRQRLARQRAICTQRCRENLKHLQPAPATAKTGHAALKKAPAKKQKKQAKAEPYFTAKAVETPPPRKGKAAR